MLAAWGDDFVAPELSSEAIDSFATRRLESVCRDSVNGSLSVLRAALRHAVRAELLERLPVDVKLLRVTRKSPRVLKPEQVDSLVDSAGPETGLMLLLAARCGLRHREILHLQRRDLDLAERTVHVSAKTGWCPKSHEERTVPLPRGLARRLADHLAPRNDESPTAWVFPGYEGGPLKSAFPQIRRAFQTAGLYDPATKPGLHMLRRTFASTLLGNGADIETVRQLGGWADLTTVQRYVTSTDERKRAAVESLEE
jgi:integrase